METSENLFIKQINEFIKRYAGNFADKRILLLNVNYKLISALELLGKTNSKIVALGKGDLVYDLPFYWKIKYINADLTEIKFPHSLYDNIFVFIENPSKKNLKNGYMKPDELARILKPNSSLFLFFLDLQSFIEKEDYIKILNNHFKLYLDENTIIKLINLKNENKRNINTIYVYHPDLLQDGITEYAKHLIYRLQKRGFKVKEGLPSKEDENDVVLVEYEELLALTNKIKKLDELPKNSIIEIHSKTLKYFRENLTYLYHGVPSHYNLDFEKINWYYVPHIAYEIEIPNSIKKYDFCSFGFWSRFKRFDQIKKLKGKKKLIMSFNYLISDDNFIKDQCLKNIKYPLNFICKTRMVNSKNLKLIIKMKYSLLKFFNTKVIIKNYISNEELIKELSECKSFIFFQETDAPSSGSMRLAASYGVPVYAKDNLRAKDSQAIRFKDIKEIYNLPKEKILIDDGLDYILSLIQYKS